MKHVVDIDPETMQPAVVATFDLVNDVVVADYKDEHYRTMLALNGIYTTETGKVRPEDGRPFYDALDRAYRQSTFRHVVGPA